MSTPNNKLTFGKFNGYSLKDVYLFEPDYIQWLMINHDTFCVDPEDFYKLPTIDSNNTLQSLYLDAFEKIGIKYTDAAVKLHTEGKLRLGKCFKFSNTAIEANNEKRSLKKESATKANYSHSTSRGSYRVNIINEAFDGDPSATWNID
jgi:hypothetical protein